MGLRDEQVAAILRGVQASERYAREARDKIDFLEQKIDMLQASIEEQQVLLERVVTNDDLLTMKILRPEKKNQRLSAYKEVLSQLANAVVAPLLDFSRAARDTQQLSKDLTYKQLPDYLREKGKQELRALALRQGIPTNRCRDFWLEEDLLAAAYRNRARLIKPNETTDIAPFGQGEPSYSAEIDAVSSSVMGQQQVGDKRPTEEEDSDSSKSSLVSRLRFIRNLVQSIIGTICVTTIQHIRKTFTLLTFAIKQTVDLDTSCSTSLFASAYLSHLRCPLPS
ncbi:hypothetical protein BD560DRAFT_428998 [Blakeslea trispora]|nr:hypothetical protein BD560DRAFT_428998 [Blakeslea trispora]